MARRAEEIVRVVGKSMWRAVAMWLAAGTNSGESGVRLLRDYDDARAGGGAGDVAAVGRD